MWKNCYIFVLDLFQICLRFVLDLSQICVRFVLDLFLELVHCYCWGHSDGQKTLPQDRCLPENVVRNGQHLISKLGRSNHIEWSTGWKKKHYVFCIVISDSHLSFIFWFYLLSLIYLILLSHFFFLWKDSDVKCLAMVPFIPEAPEESTPPSAKIFV